MGFQHSLDRRINIPLWGVPIRDWIVMRLKSLFDPRPSASNEFRMLNTGELINFTKEVLAVDELKGPARERLELDTVLGEVFALRERNFLNNVYLTLTTEGIETLFDSAYCTWPRNNKLIFRKIGERAVVEISDVLIGEEITKQRIGSKDAERFSHPSDSSDPCGNLILNHPL